MLTGDLLVEHFGHSKAVLLQSHHQQLLLNACCPSTAPQLPPKNGAGRSVEYTFNTKNVAPNFDSFSLEEKIGRPIVTMSDVQVCPYPQRRTQVDGPQCRGGEGGGGGGRLRVATATTTVTISTKWLIDAEDDWRRSRSAAAGETTTGRKDDDFNCIRSCVMRLESSGFYYGQLTWQEAAKLLVSTEVGTFLVRDSSDPAYLFALSVQTECGPTSIRIHYANGLFKLDAEDILAGHMPRFDCAVKLIDYYAKRSGDETTGCRHVWLDGSGRRDRAIVIKRPLYNQVRPLQHLCRVAVNKNKQLQRIQQLSLPKTLQTFVSDYPCTR